MLFGRIDQIVKLPEGSFVGRDVLRFQIGTDYSLSLSRQANRHDKSCLNQLSRRVKL